MARLGPEMGVGHRYAGASGIDGHAKRVLVERVGVILEHEARRVRVGSDTHRSGHPIGDRMGGDGSVALMVVSEEAQRWHAATLAAGHHGGVTDWCSAEEDQQ